MGIWEISVPSTQFYCESKTALKIVLFNKWENMGTVVIIQKLL